MEEHSVSQEQGDNQDITAKHSNETLWFASTQVLFKSSGHICYSDTLLFDFHFSLHIQEFEGELHPGLMKGQEGMDRELSLQDAQGNRSK